MDILEVLNDISLFLHKDILLSAYLILVLLDYITGFLKAYKEEGFKSRKIRDGVLRTVGEFIAIIFGVVVDEIAGTNGIITLSIKTLFVFKEGISIIENLAVIGVDIKFITKYLEDFKDKK